MQGVEGILRRRLPVSHLKSTAVVTQLEQHVACTCCWVQFVGIESWVLSLLSQVQPVLKGCISRPGRITGFGLRRIWNWYGVRVFRSGWCRKPGYTCVGVLCVWLSCYCVLAIFIIG